MKQSLAMFTCLFIISVSGLSAMQFTLSDDELDAVQKALFIAESERYIAASKIHFNEAFFQHLRPSFYDEKTLSKLESYINAGADLHYCNEWGQTPLAYAVANRAQREIINALIKGGSDVNRPGILEKAFCNGDFGMIKLLVEHGANMQRVVDGAASEWLHGYFASMKDIVERVMEAENQEQNSVDEVPQEGVPEIMPQENVAEFVSEIVPDIILQESIQEPLVNDALTIPQTQELEVEQIVYSVEDNSSASQDPIPLPILADNKPVPQIPASDPQVINTPEVHQAQITFFESMCAHPLVMIVGVGAVATMCYWAYVTYKTDQKDQEPAEQGDEQVSSSELVVAE